MKIYLEVTSVVAKSWQVGKWVNEVALGKLTPMWADWGHSPDQHLYVSKVAHTRDERYLVLRRWIVYNGKEHAEAHLVTINHRVHPMIKVIMSVALIIVTIDRVIHTRWRESGEGACDRVGLEICQSDTSWISHQLPWLVSFMQSAQLSDHIPGSSLNPDRMAAGGKPLFSLCVMPCADDASGNWSKQYNPHINICTQNLNIPHEKLKH